MDAIKYLRQEHSRFRKTLREISKISDGRKKVRKFTNFCQELVYHETMEQKAWYPTLRKDKELRNIIKHLLAEEKSAAQTIKKFKKINYGVIWNLRFFKFHHDVDHHAREEEKKLFPKVRQKFSKSDLNKLGIKMRKFKNALKRKST